MIKKINIKLLPQEAQDDNLVVKYALEKAQIKKRDLTDFLITKKSIDSRRIPVKIDVSITLYVGEKAPSLYNPIEFKKATNDKVIIVGMGPAGLFAALKVLENGYTPILIERGEKVEDRRKSVAAMIRDNKINEESNYCYGEGGAGAFSDGKLFTRSKKRGNVNEVLSLFVQMGAPSSILTEAHPHLGTDKLPSIIKNMRNTILDNGGQIIYKTKVVDIIKEEKKVVGVVSDKGDKYLGPVILATGHSAKDIYKLLGEKDIEIEAKSIAIGLRVEHAQSFIDQVQYKSKKGRGKYLPPAEYRLVSKVNDRGVFSFCMCPGGSVVPSHTENGYTLVNGMSSSSRGGKWANSAIVTEIRVEDVLENNDPLSMLKFQEQIEKNTFSLISAGVNAPAQRVSDFVKQVESKDLPQSSYLGTLESKDLNQIFPKEVAKCLRGGFISFNKKIPGFISENAIVIASETRTSSPVRILRDKESFMSNAGLFPCGEGAGYAGGIVSSALDGINCALAAIRYLS
jgi:uncharacterized FAD-dependent dehydrogenase